MVPTGFEATCMDGFFSSKDKFPAEFLRVLGYLVFPCSNVAQGQFQRFASLFSFYSFARLISKRFRWVSVTMDPGVLLCHVIIISEGTVILKVGFKNILRGV